MLVHIGLNAEKSLETIPSVASWESQDPVTGSDESSWGDGLSAVAVGPVIQSGSIHGEAIPGVRHPGCGSVGACGCED